MELFLSDKIENGQITLDQQESMHCVKVLRHVKGDEIFVIDGEGTLYKIKITEASPKSVTGDILSQEADFGSHPYYLHICVSPLKSSERYEIFLEKATEIGIDEVSPLICERTEKRGIFKNGRAEKILLSATKQSLKGKIPGLNEPVKFRDFVDSVDRNFDGVKLIAYCGEDAGHKISLVEALKEDSLPENKYIICIGPEGDFSLSEVEYALNRGFRVIHLGASRLRTETAAIVAVSTVYSLIHG